MTTRYLFVALVFIGALSGCSAYDAPTLSVAAARVVQETDYGIVVDFTLDVANSNEVEIPLERVRYSLKLNGERVFTGARYAEATVRRLGTQQITLPAAIDLAEFDMPEGEVQYELSGAVVYITPGAIAQLIFDAGLPRPKTKFRHRGTLDFGDGQ